MDPFVINLLAVVLLFEDLPGLSAIHEIHNEKAKYFRQLDLYIQGKISSGHWTHVLYQEVWDNIRQVIVSIHELNQILIQFVKENPIPFY